MKVSLKIIACSVLENEIKAAAAKLGVSIFGQYLKAGLHEEPEKLRNELQQAVYRASKDVDEGLACWDAIVIGYGLCGRGTVGLKAGSIPLIMPRVHDCIALFLGSAERYSEEFKKNPGSLYMTAGWYEHKTQPLSVKRTDGADFEGNWDINIGFDSMEKKYGSENASEIYNFINSWKRNYTRSVFIDTGTEDNSTYENYARDLATGLNWKYERLEGSGALLEAMLNRELTNEEILLVPPRYMTAYDPGKNGLYAYDPNAGPVSLWDRKLPDSGEPGQSKKRGGFGLGIDAGGTYTDVVVYDFSAAEVIASTKAPTVKWDYTRGIIQALGMIEPELLLKVDLTVVSTTLATNAIVEGRGRRVGLLLMPLGEIAENSIDHRPRRVIGGRMSIRGDELEAVSEDEIKKAAAEIIEKYHVEAFAVSGFGSTANPSHELKVKQIIEAETGLGVCCGHELSNALNFFIRANTAVLNAGIIPLVEQFIAELEQALSEMNISGSVMIVRGDGALMSREMAVHHPVETTLSGPAASITGASFLTGAEDALVIDVGGTTSDIGLVKSGRIRLAEEGALVGSFRTHIKAVDMFTLGAGGDSRILLESRTLKVGPQRVVPAGRLQEIRGYEQAVAFIEKLRSDYCNSTAAMEILALTGECSDWKLSNDEEKIVDLLSLRPHSVKELAVKLKNGLWNILPTARLENSAVIQRFGLTPTDLLVSGGRVSLWPSFLSKRIVDLYRIIRGDEHGEFEDQVFELITDKLLKTLLLQELEILGDNVAREAESPLLRTLLTNLKGKSSALRLIPKLSGRLVGVGAAAPWLLEGLSSRLNTELVIPQNGEVANAVGAVCSMVTVRREASVIPSPDGGFMVNGLEHCPHFESYTEACDYLEENIAKAVREDALKAGTREKGILWHAENRTSPVSDGNYIFLGRDYRLEITGLPV